jgi:hypothetical protein
MIHVHVLVYKKETDVGVPKIPMEFSKFLCMGCNFDSAGL